MEFKQIQELLKSINKSNIGTFKYKQGDFELVIKQQGSAEAQIVNYQPVAQPQLAAPVMPSAPAAPAAQVEAPKATEAASSNQIIVKSPMIGTFYRKSSPDKPAFVNVGDSVKAGDVVCIIEAMKLFNEIESEFTGTIVKVLVDDATPVEYDQPLFIIEP